MVLPLLLLVMLTSCAAVPQDLASKMLTFPERNSTAHVRLTTSRQELSAVTVCLRFFTDLKTSYPLFSLATPSTFNDFLMFKGTASDLIYLWARDKYLSYEGQDFKVNRWQSLCGTWNAASGVGQLWLDGLPSSRKLISSGSNIKGPIIIVLGQDQDSYGGGFDQRQPFVGMMSDVHMWDYTLPPCNIQHYVDEQTFPPGNVLNWNSLEFQIVGKVLIEEKQKNCH